MKLNQIVNPLKRRRLNLGLSQEDMANRLGVTQSQYSRIEKAKTEPKKYLDKLGKIFGCLPEEVFGRAILKEIEDEYLNDTKKIQRMEYHEKRLDAVYLNLIGWFSKKELDLVMDTIDEGITNIRHWRQEQEQDDFKQRLAVSVARARVEAEQRVQASVEKVGNDGN